MNEENNTDIIKNGVIGLAIGATLIGSILYSVIGITLDKRKSCMKGTYYGDSTCEFVLDNKEMREAVQKLIPKYESSVENYLDASLQVAEDCFKASNNPYLNRIKIDNDGRIEVDCTRTTTASNEYANVQIVSSENEIALSCFGEDCPDGFKDTIIEYVPRCARKSDLKPKESYFLTTFVALENNQFGNLELTVERQTKDNPTGKASRNALYGIIADKSINPNLRANISGIHKRVKSMYHQYQKR